MVTTYLLEYVLGKRRAYRNERRCDGSTPDSRFRVTLDNGHNLVAYTGWKNAQKPYPNFGGR